MLIVSNASLRLILAVTLSLICASPVVGQPPAEGEEPQPAEESSVLGNVEELSAFIDGLMAAHMPSQNIPTATISIVKDGQLLFAKGYGYANRQERTPVDPEKTLFRPGSVSKLFTWTAVMQLHERGQLDLDADVNQYLTNFQIPATYPEPITLKHLLTHTPGFEDGALGYLFVKSAGDIVPLEESLKAHIPWRVRSPGTYSSYSNFGTALAGLIVANVADISFEEFVERNIFAPLGMKDCTFREPLPDRLAAQMATGYRRNGGVYEEGDFEFISNFGPAGALSCSATDMARFMIMHLQHGRYEDVRVLKEETARQMHSQLYTLDPRLPGMAHGFYETRMNGQHMIGHGGDTELFHSNLVLLPQHDIGLYVSYVTAGGQARVQLLKGFLDRFFPEPDSTLPTMSEDFQERGQRYAGSYRFTRHNSSTIEKLLALATTFSVSVTPDNTLSVAGVFPEPAQFVEVEPLLFQQIDGWETIAFKESEAGDITHMFFGQLPFMPTYRAPWYTTPGFSLALLAAGALLSLTMLISAFYHRKESRLAPALSRWAIRLGVLLSALTLLFWISFVALVSSYAFELAYGIPASLSAILVLPLITSLLAVGVLALAITAWRRRFWTFVRRTHYTLFALAALMMTWFYFHWNILGFHFQG